VGGATGDVYGAVVEVGQLAALIGFALSRVVKAGVATAPADTAAKANGDTVGGEG